MIPNDGPNYSPDGVARHSPLEGASELSEQELSNLSVPQTSLTTVQSIVWAKLGEALEVLNLAPRWRRQTSTAVLACLSLDPPSALTLTSSLHCMRGLDQQQIQHSCAALETVFLHIFYLDESDRIACLKSATALLACAVSPKVYYRTTEFLLHNVGALTSPYFDRLFETVTKSLTIPEIDNGRELSQLARLELVDQALQAHWRSDYLTRILEAFRSPAHTQEGYARRIEASSVSTQSKTSLVHELQAITDIEFFCASQRLAPQQITFLLRNSQASQIANCLRFCSPYQVGKQFVDIITAPCSRPITDEALTILTNYMISEKNLDISAFLNQLHCAVNDGCSLDLACATLARRPQTLHLLDEIVRPLSEKTTDFAVHRRALYEAVDAFFLRISRRNDSLNVQNLIDLISTLVTGFTDNSYESPRRGACTLVEPTSVRKLLVCLKGDGLKDYDAVSDEYDLEQLIITLAAHEDIDLVLSSEASDLLARQEMFNSRYHADNPPFSIQTTPIEIQERFSSQIWSIFLRAQDAHHGFWSNTYEFRHTPIGHRCPYDEMTLGWNAERYLVPCSNINDYPGPGRVVQGIDISTMFGTLLEDEALIHDVLGSYGPLPDVQTQGNVHALDNLTRARIVHTRAFEAFSVDDNPFFSFMDIPMTLIIWNHHFDATGVAQVSLVPSKALRFLLEEHLVPLDQNLDSQNVFSSTIRNQPPTRRALARAAVHLGLHVGVIDVTSPSNFTGGLCNGLAAHSLPLHNWEGDDDITDWFGHSHKWHIKKQDSLLRELFDAHTRLYEITTGYLNVRDIFKLGCGLDARGFSERYRTPSYHGQAWEDTQHMIQHGREKLKFLCEFSDEYRRVNRAGAAPVLVLAPMHYTAPQPESPIVLDGITGYGFHQWGAPFDLNIRDGQPSEELLEWWSQHVDPWLDARDHFWYAPRLVARENYVKQMEEYGYRR